MDKRIDDFPSHDGKKVVIWLGVVIVVGVTVLVVLLVALRDDAADRVAQPAPAGQGVAAQLVDEDGAR